MRAVERCADNAPRHRWRRRCNLWYLFEIKKRAASASDIRVERDRTEAPSVEPRPSPGSSKPAAFSLSDPAHKRRLRCRPPPPDPGAHSPRTAGYPIRPAERAAPEPPTPVAALAATSAEADERRAALKKKFAGRFHIVAATTFCYKSSHRLTSRVRTHPPDFSDRQRPLPARTIPLKTHTAVHRALHPCVALWSTPATTASWSSAVTASLSDPDNAPDPSSGSAHTRSIHA